MSPTFGFFFTKTIFSLLLLALLCISGWLAYRALIKESDPDLKIPMALVMTSWPGAAPEQVEKQITTPIEKQIKSLKGLKRYRSGSSNSVSSIIVEFRAEASIEESMQLLRNQVAGAESLLPKAAKKPHIEPISVSDTPVVSFMLFGDHDAALLDREARRLETSLEKIPGMKKVDVWGNTNEIVSIRLIPSRLTDLGISPIAVKEKIHAANVDMPWGRFENERFTATMKFTGMFRDLDELKRLPITRLQYGRLVRLEEIAQVRREMAKVQTQASVSVGGDDFQECVTLEIYRLPGQDTIELIERARTLMETETAKPGWPKTLQYKVISDESELIWENLTNVFNNGWQAMLAVFVVLLCMLSWREALIAGLSIPVTFLGVLAILWGFGYTLNQLVIIGMVLALGLLVDDFILVMEGMHDGLSSGKSLPEAQRFTISTYAIPSFSGSVTTVLALLPLLLIGGIEGKFIRVIPVTTALCLTMSYLVSIFLDVPLSRFVLKASASHQKKLSKVDLLTERVSGRLCQGLTRYTVRSKAVALLWVAAFMGLFLLTLAAFSELPVEMYPKEDGRKLGITVELPPDSRLEQSQVVAEAVGEVLRKKPYFEHVTKYVGMKSPMVLNSAIEFLAESQASNFSGFSCMFTPKNQRDRLAYQYLGELRAELNETIARFPGAVVTFSPELGGSSAEDPIQVEVTGDNMETLRHISAQIREALGKTAGARDVRDTLGPTRTDVSFEPLREALDFYQISEADLALQIRLAMTSEKVGRFLQTGTQDDLNIYLGMIWKSRQGKLGGPKAWEELELLNVITETGERVLAGSILQPHITQEALSLTHKDGRRSVTVLAKVFSRTAGEVLQDFRPALDAMKAGWPEGYGYAFAGEAEQSGDTFSKSGIALLVAVCLVFSVLALLFDSFTQPFIIMLSVPLGLIGTFSGFYLAHIPISFPAMIGIISLVGIAVNDAIVMIETMNIHRKQGRTVQDAAARGAADRLRPILSTSITTIVGLIPLALSSPAWMPLCNAIIFGLIASTLVSLFVIPALFVLLTPETRRQEAEEYRAEPLMT